MDRIDAHKALVQGAGKAEVQAPDMITVGIHTRSAPGRSRLLYETPLVRSVIAGVPVVLFRGDYWPLQKAAYTGARFIVVEEE